MIQVIVFENKRLTYLDQRFLPLKEVFVHTKDYRKVIEAIKTLAIRGAPLIGIAAAYAAALAVQAYKGKKSGLKRYFYHALSELDAARPTAVNLFWATARARAAFNRVYEQSDISTIAKAILEEAEAIHQKEVQNCDAIARHGTELLRRDFAHQLLQRRLTVLTHCNTGTLATGGIGTALGVIKQAYLEGLIEKVFVSETRPLLQGLRLTTFELEKEEIPYQAIADSSAGFLFQKGMIDLVITGADRIAANGDTANKIGTYTHAVNAAFHKRKFYVAAPLSTFDATLSCGEEILIEQRAGTELTSIYGRNVAPQKTPVLNYAFDITPATLISSIITERGVAEPDFKTSLAQIAAETKVLHHD
ncbi:MAG: S-methyl-5-thioribose-1-phosphate isomerase [Chloroherpetonaceae bacterium]|nr:S-methyl-5-thioribose-1-phosphate isomerase [Chloroherpetonaceae bacterium]MCS7210967.1 S-methyl-5-thioribose-1-phosphate isomerase [Chloroherpetonaceae bacterium]MDW8020253.1 S-methyl-5-thioribose-1-phosphate isomerase [Chloroherpetonaceae bacterium]MDW8464714.1 S-methyl-5-thioribose-1-phosphate isomerase [Chloroherpetonaceae bacterium]